MAASQVSSGFAEVLFYRALHRPSVSWDCDGSFSGRQAPHLQPGELVQVLKGGHFAAPEGVNLGSQPVHLGLVLGASEHVQRERQRVCSCLVRCTSQEDVTMGFLASCSTVLCMPQTHDVTSSGGLLPDGANLHGTVRLPLTTHEDV